MTHGYPYVPMRPFGLKGPRSSAPVPKARGQLLFPTRPAQEEGLRAECGCTTLVGCRVWGGVLPGACKQVAELGKPRSAAHGLLS